MRVSFGEDILIHNRLREIPRRFPSLGLTLLHLGGIRVLGIMATLDAEQGADVVELIRPALTVPVHYDDYGVFRSPLSHFQYTMGTRRLDASLRVVLRGQTIPLARGSG